MQNFFLIIPRFCVKNWVLLLCSLRIYLSNQFYGKLLGKSYNQKYSFNYKNNYKVALVICNYKKNI